MTFVVTFVSLLRLICDFNPNGVFSVAPRCGRQRLSLEAVCIRVGDSWTHCVIGGRAYVGNDHCAGVVVLRMPAFQITALVRVDRHGGSPLRVASGV